MKRGVYIKKLNFSDLLVFGIFILIFQSVFLMINDNIFQIMLNLAWQLVMLLAFLFWSYRRSGSCVNAPSLFLIAIFYWHSAWFFCHYFQVAPVFEYTGRVFNYGSAEVPKAISFLSLCFSCALLGTLLGYGQQRKVFNKTGTSPESPRSSFSKGVILFFLAVYLLITLLYLFQIGIGFFNEKYSEAFYLLQPDTLLFRLYQSTKFFMVILIITGLAYMRHFKRLCLLSVFLALILIQFLLGSRSVPFIMIVALVVSADHFIKRFSWKMLLIFTLGLAAMSCVISYARDAVGLGWNVFNLAASGRKVNLWQSVWDAQQGGIVARTMHFVSQDGEFLYGRSIFDALVYLLPRFIVDGAGFHTGFSVPSEWLVQLSGDVPAGGGLGFSLVAEAYLNFGITGCLLFLYVGWFISKNYFRYVFLKDRYALLHALNFSLILSLHMRNDIGSYMRYLVYGFLFIEILKRLDRRSCK